MGINDYTWIAIIAVAALIILVFAVKTGSFLKSVLTSSVIGIITLFVLYFTSCFTGFKLEITAVNIIISTFLGLPGVVGLVFVKLLI